MLQLFKPESERMSMSRFVGNECPICNKKFTDKDDIVACPECGTPYHRECIKQNGNTCVMNNLHETHTFWKSKQEEKEEFAKRMVEAEGAGNVCPRCGTVNGTQDTLCKICGSVLAPVAQKTQDTTNPPQDTINPPQDIQHNPYQTKGADIPPFGADPKSGFEPNQHYNRPNINDTDNQNQLPPGFMPYNPYTTPFGGLNPDELIDGVAVKDLAVFIGRGSDQYLIKFKIMGRSVMTLNLAAFFFNGLFFLYRKMYGLGTLVLLSFVVLSVPGMLISLNNMILSVLPSKALPINVDNLATIASVFSVLRLSVMFFSGMMANRIYRSHCISKVKSIKSLKLNEREYYATLNKRGGVNMNIIILLLAVYFGLSFLLSAFIVLS